MSATLTIRQAHPNDLAPLDALFARAYPRLLKADYPPSVLVLAVPLIARAQPRLLRVPTYFVAEAEDGRIVGAGGWTPSAPGVGDMRHVVVDDRHQRQGIGRRIFDATLGTAKAARLSTLECSATRTAEPFYRAMGFRRIAPIEVELRPGIVFPAIRMVRPIRGVPSV